MRMTKGHWKTWTVLFLVAASGAAADVGGGLRAFRDADYETAQRLLSEDDARFNVKALLARGRMALEGLGQAPDYDEAYVLLSLAAQFGSAEDGMTALTARADADDHLDETRIRAAETRVVALVNERYGADEVTRQVSKRIGQIEACTKGCDGIASQLFAFGPAAFDAVPALEAVMTRDLYWQPREAYATALMLIGTASVPALCRIMADKSQLLHEGPYNTEMALTALMLMGTGARGALTCVMEALDRPYPPMPLSPPYPSPEEHAALVKDVKGTALGALRDIGDPERRIADRLRAYFEAEPDLELQVLAAAVICHDHADHGPATGLAPQVLAGPPTGEQGLMLAVLERYCAELPGFDAALGPVWDDIRRIAEQGSKAAEVANRLLSRFGH